jgi:branched-chain amino acid transport system ATP-binding protein
MSTAAPVLAVEGLEVRYGNVRVLKDVTLQVFPGELCALVGPNGSGKSTTLRTVQGLLAPARGVIRLRGEPVEGLPPHERARRGIASIPERRRLFDEMTVRENLELGAFREAARGRAAEALDMVNHLFPPLHAKASLRAWTLSGGEQQMLAVGRALMARPDLLLMDDPFAGLAPPLTEGLCDVIRTISGRGVAVLIAGQHVRRILTLAHRAYLLEAGRITAEDTGPGLLASRTLRRSLLET